MVVMLVRVGADSTDAGGRWHSPANVASKTFTYVPITEDRPELLSERLRPYRKRYIDHTGLVESLRTIGEQLPPELPEKTTHLDPDYACLTYGDFGARAACIRKNNLDTGDIIVFYSALRPIGVPHQAGGLIYGLTGMLTLACAPMTYDDFIVMHGRDHNAHTRRDKWADTSDRKLDLVIVGDPKGSGRFLNYIEIGSHRPNCLRNGRHSYRIRRELIADHFGEISASDGYLERSAYLPIFREPDRFMAWLHARKPQLIHSNW
jgi:Nucleotide modification associated domain 3